VWLFLHYLYLVDENSMKKTMILAVLMATLAVVLPA